MLANGQLIPLAKGLRPQMLAQRLSRDESAMLNDGAAGIVADSPSELNCPRISGEQPDVLSLSWPEDSRAMRQPKVRLGCATVHTLL